MGSFTVCAAVTKSTDRVTGENKINAGFILSHLSTFYNTWDKFYYSNHLYLASNNPGSTPTLVLRHSLVLSSPEDKSQALIGTLVEYYLWGPFCFLVLLLFLLLFLRHEVVQVLEVLLGEDRWEEVHGLPEANQGQHLQVTMTETDLIYVKDVNVSR